MRLGTLKAIALVGVFAQLIGSLFVIWLIASVVTSGMKAGLDQCSRKYGIEKYYVDGNFFCGK